MQRFPAIFILLLLVGLAACQTAAPAPTAMATNIPGAIPASPTVATVDYCVSCHTDKEQLISTAKPVEVAESESKGAG